MTPRKIIIERCEANPEMFCACREDYDLGDEMGHGAEPVDALASLLYWEGVHGKPFEGFTVVVR
jgi:hypothetical protein